MMRDASVESAQAVPGYQLRFPHDEGAHSEFRTEWWYVSGWLDAASKPLGFQITFFRVRSQNKKNDADALASPQMIIAHAALSDPAHGKLMHEERATHAGGERAGAEEGRTRTWIGEWSLEQREEAYVARLPAAEFKFDFRLLPTQPHLLQGENGLSRKGPSPKNASYYYSLPHLELSGTLARRGQSQAVTGSAWLDHEWSSNYLAAEAVGWDWIGINFTGGAALMAFRMRNRQGGSHWAGGTLRSGNGNLKVFSPSDVRFIGRREWRSPRTGASYPVSWLVKVEDMEIAIEPLFDDQERYPHGARRTIYWEGAVRALIGGKPAGHGYLELTGYARRPEL